MPKPSRQQTLLGFDFGMKRIGIAVGQTLTQTAQPLAVLKAHKGEPVWADIQALIEIWQANALVVGIPLHMNGTEQPLTHDAREFAKKLGDRFLLPVYTIDERLTTIEARQQLHEQGKLKDNILSKTIDSYAAKLILEQWLRKMADEETAK